MHTLNTFFKSGRLSVMTLALALGSSGWAWAQAPGQKAKGKEPITLNFVNADIEAVARTLASLSGHNVVVDPRVKGTLSLSSQVAVPPAQALHLFATQLRTQGFALIESAGLYTVLPEAEAKGDETCCAVGAVAPASFVPPAPLSSGPSPQMGPASSPS